MQFEVRDAGDLRAAVRALGQAANGKQLKKELARELRAEIRPTVARIRSAWRSAPSGRGPRRGRRSLRAELARATRGEVRLSGREAGVRIRTDGRRMPSGSRGLPGHAEGVSQRGRWRHPVFGDRDVWVQQRPFPRFYAAIRPDAGRARREVEQAVEQVFKQIARGR